ncbi:MAG TPA: UDP-N-acetylmuramate dehydrogenase [Bryobacteraceae bacterium]|jgi:UDP-N-acetylmuramate dehydrogenase
MPLAPAAANRLAAIPDLMVLEGAPLAAYTRFEIGGPAALLCDTASEPAFLAALRLVETLAVPRIVIGGGTNLVISDSGFDGVVLRYTGSEILRSGVLLEVQAGAVLQGVVDHSMEFGLKGLQTMTGIPGYLGGAVYGNAGAYGHAIEELVAEIRFTDGARVHRLTNEQCQFHYRESIFKDNKDWVILSASLRFEQGDPAELRATANEIRAIRDAKYPPTMRCAGSIFKNLLFDKLPAGVRAEVPAKVVREGKVPSAWFLEQVGGKGIRRGDIQVATYHANLVYNDGVGTAADLVAVVQELKRRVRDRFGFELEEEVQYVGFEYAETPA